MVNNIIYKRRNTKTTFNILYINILICTYMKGGNPKVRICDDVSDMGKLSGKLMYTHSN